MSLYKHIVPLLVALGCIAGACAFSEESYQGFRDLSPQNQDVFLEQMEEYRDLMIWNSSLNFMEIGYREEDAMDMANEFVDGVISDLECIRWKTGRPKIVYEE